MTTQEITRPWWDKITPRASVRVQMFSAAVMWLVGLSFLLVRGVGFLVELVRIAHPAVWSLATIVIGAVIIGSIKARYILIKYADKAVARIQTRGHACYFGFFAPASWAFILVMMGGGIALRQFTPLPHYVWGLVFLATLYIAVGTGLAIADRIFWISAMRSEPVPEAISAVE